MLKSQIILRNNTGLLPKDELIQSFVIREKEFNHIISEIKFNYEYLKKQNFLIIGQRGAGKTTLVYRLKYGIEDTESLGRKIITIMFSEEQYNLSDLTDFFMAIASYLEDYNGWNGLTNEIESIIHKDLHNESLLFELLEVRIKSKQKHVIIFIENINIFLKKIEEKGRNQLKVFLKKSEVFQIVGTSTSVNDGNINFSEEFYDFLEKISLDGLDKESCVRLLLKISRQFGEDVQIQNIIDNHPGRVEALRRLTGGNPRIISYLFQIFIDNENGKAIRDLYLLSDNLTFLYKYELDQLSSQQQKVVDVIAKKWDAVGVKEIAKLTRLESKNISSILSVLEKNQVIEKVTTDTKNKLYRIKERFMNIWYLMRFGRKQDKENVIWLVKFFDAWCDQSELSMRALSYINKLQGGNYDLEAAIDMGIMFLSCQKISESLKWELYKAAKSNLPEKMRKEVQLSKENISGIVRSYIEKGDFDQAIEIAEEVVDKDKKNYTLLSYLYLEKGEYEKSVEAAQIALSLDSEDASAALVLGLIYEDFLNDIQLAVKYFTLSTTRKIPHPYAFSRLGDYELYFKSNLEEAKNLHERAIKRGIKDSLFSLGEIYFKQGRIEMATEKFLEAAKAGVGSVYTRLGKLYELNEDFLNAEDSYKKAVENSEKNALINIGQWYKSRKNPDYEKAKESFEVAYSQGVKEAYSSLAMLYLQNLNNEKKAIKLLNEGIKIGDAESAHQLAHIYLGKKNFEKSDLLFQQAADLGNKYAILCMVHGVYYYGRTNEKEYILLLLEKNIIELRKCSELKNITKVRRKCLVDLLYAKILLWNNQIEKSIQVLIEIFKDIKIISESETDGINELYFKPIVTQLTNFFLLLLAKKEYEYGLILFEDNSVIDLKIILKPIYFVLMEFLGESMEFKKAGTELSETIEEIKVKIIKLKKNV